MTGVITKTLTLNDKLVKVEKREVNVVWIWSITFIVKACAVHYINLFRNKISIYISVCYGDTASLRLCNGNKRWSLNTANLLSLEGTLWLFGIFQKCIQPKHHNCNKSQETRKGRSNQFKIKANFSCTNLNFLRKFKFEKYDNSDQKVLVVIFWVEQDRAVKLAAFPRQRSKKAP